MCGFVYVGFVMCGGSENCVGVLVICVLVILISNFRRVLNVIYFLLSDSPASEFYMPTFRNTLSLPSSTRTYLPMKMEQSVPKRRHKHFRRRGITKKKADNMCTCIYWLLYSLYAVLYCFFCVYLFLFVTTRVGTLIVATIYLQLVQNRYMFRS